MAGQSRKAKPSGKPDTGGKDTSEYRFPDFLCIGAQKAATTWLDKNMRRHPRLWLPPIKELQYFNDVHVPRSRRWTADHRRHRGKQVLQAYLGKTEAAEWDYRYIARLADIIDGPISDDWYGRIFALAKPDQICGEITPDYCTLPDEGIRHILSLSPQVKIILSLRDPIERTWSHLRMVALTRGINDTATLERFASDDGQYQSVDYPSMITNWRRFIPQDRFFVTFMDDVAACPHAVLKSVCELLGVEYQPMFFKKADKVIYAGEAREMPPGVEAILTKRFRSIYENLTALYPEIGARWSARYC